MKKFLNEFKEFALKGNALELAIGVIIGGAFNQIVTSLVNDIIMPVFGLIIGNDIANNAFVLVPGTEETQVLLKWGSFLQSVINFVIIALTIFVFIKVISSFNKKRVEEEVVEEVAAPSEEVVLLQDILSELKKK